MKDKPNLKFEGYGLRWGSIESASACDHVCESISRYFNRIIDLVAFWEPEGVTFPAEKVTFKILVLATDTSQIERVRSMIDPHRAVDLQISIPEHVYGEDNENLKAIDNILTAGGPFEFTPAQLDTLRRTVAESIWHPMSNMPKASMEALGWKPDRHYGSATIHIRRNFNSSGQVMDVYDHSFAFDTTRPLAYRALPELKIKGANLDK